MRKKSQEQFMKLDTHHCKIFKTIQLCASLLCLILVQTAHADFFVDNKTKGCSSGSKTYNPATRSCSGGSDTVYTSWSKANSGISSGSRNERVVVNVRAGAEYFETVDITKAWTTWKKYPGDSNKPVITGKWTLVHEWTGLIDIRAQGVTIDGIEIKNTGHYPNDKPDKSDVIGHGVYVVDYNNDATVRNCYIHHTGGHAIGAKKSDNLLIENNKLYENHYGKLEGTRETWGSAIMTSFGCDNVTIRGNTIHGIGGEGLNLNRIGKNYLIEDNTIYDCLMPALFINGIQDVTCRRNLVYHTNTYRYGGGGHPGSNLKGLIVAAESWYRPAGTYTDAIDVDVYDNKVAGFSIPFGIAEVHDWAGYQVSDIRFYNNTIIEPFSGGCAFYVKENSVGKGIVVKNNIFWQERSSKPIASFPYSSAITFEQNLWSKAPPRLAQDDFDPRYGQYSPINIADYFQKSTGWDKLLPGALKATDFNLLPSAEHAFTVNGDKLGSTTVNRKVVAPILELKVTG
jgi:hypothetical protein